jgi:Concanavalin A-like lectin/glucanases superfamily
MKRLLLYLSCFLLVGGSGAVLQGCETWEVPSENTLSITEGLVAYLPFTKGSLKDSISTGTTRASNDAIWGNPDTKPTFTEDFSGAKGGSKSAISFNGTSDFIKLIDNPKLQFKTTLTISLWIKPDVKQLKDKGVETPMQIFHKSAYEFPNNNESYSSQVRVVITYYTDNINPGSIRTNSSMFLPGFKMENTDSKCELSGPGWQVAPFFANSSFLELDFWHHIVFSCDESTFTSYLDGNLINSTKLRGGQIQSCPGGDLRFGIQFKESPLYFKGAMDEIRIYDRQLNENEVKSLYGLKNVTK